MLSEVLSALLCSNNDARRQAESKFSTLLEQNYFQTVQTLIEVLGNKTADISIRALSGVLLRSAIEKHSKQLNHGSLSQLRLMFIQIWSEETNTVIFRRLNHILAQLYTTEKWEEMIPTLIQIISNKDIKASLPLLNLIEILADYGPEYSQANLNSLGAFLGGAITANDSDIRIACARSICSCIVGLDDETQRDSFRAALMPIMSVLGETLGAGNEADATSIMDHLVTIANIQPVFFKGATDSIVSSMLSVANSTALEYTTRIMAIEFLVTLGETAPALARRCEFLVTGLIPILFTLVAGFDEEESDWVRGKYTDEVVEGDHTAGAY